MAPVKKAATTKKNQLQLKKGKKVVEVQQEEEDNEDMDDSDEEEDDHDQESDNAEDKELNMDLKNDGDEDDNDDDESDDEDEEKDDDDEEEDDDMDEGSPKKKQVTVEKKKQASENSKEHTKESRGESDARSLYIGKLPDGVTEQNLKDLSKDIVEIYFPQKPQGNNRFAFIRFADEATAESNLAILQTKTIKDQPLTVDYCGSKSSFNKDQRKEDNSAKKLFVGNLPEDVTEEDFKSLSEDIVEIYISQGPKKYGFLTFDSKEKAESNYEILKDQKIRGQQIFVDHKNSRSANGVKQISVSGLPLDVTIEQVAKHFKKAFQITLNRSNSFRTATISFDTEEDAKEANDAAKDVTISEHKLTSVLCENTENRPERGQFGGRGHFRGGRGQFRGGRGQFRGGRNDWGKRSHDGGNFRGGRGGQGFAKRMRN